MPITKTQFRDAISHLTGSGALSGTGDLFLDADGQKVLDEGNGNEDITPNEATITQALIDLQASEDAKAVSDSEDSTAFSDFQSIVQTALAQITSDETALANAASFADLKPLLANMMLRDRKTIKALSGIIRKRL